MTETTKDQLALSAIKGLDSAAPERVDSCAECEVPRNAHSDLKLLAALRERPPIDDEYLDTATLAAFFKLSESFFAKLRVSGGGPPFIKIGSQARYRFGDVKRWAADHFTRRSTSEIDPARAA